MNAILSLSSYIHFETKSLLSSSSRRSRCPLAFSLKKSQRKCKKHSILIIDSCSKETRRMMPRTRRWEVDGCYLETDVRFRVSTSFQIQMISFFLLGNYISARALGKTEFLLFIVCAASRLKALMDEFRNHKELNLQIFPTISTCQTQFQKSGNHVKITLFFTQMKDVCIRADTLTCDERNITRLRESCSLEYVFF